MLSLAKRLVCRGACAFGLTGAALRSRWRARRISFLCYHGISLDDEHRCSSLFMHEEQFRRRLETIRNERCNVLPLGQAVESLYAGSLPPRSVVLTFDDGFFDFYAKAWPILREFGWPVTVYLTTYYSSYNVPVFDPMVIYLVWKGRGKELRLPELGIPTMAIGDDFMRHAAVIQDAAWQRRLSGHQKNELLNLIAERLHVDMDSLRSRRILHLMNPGEVSELAAQGVDFQLHCHRHRVFNSHDRFVNELDENRRVIESFGAPRPRHFCYPSGFRLPEFPPWLAEMKVLSATTCEPGIATRRSDRFELPRFLDGPAVGADEFRLHLSGLGSLLPARARQPRDMLGDSLFASPAAPGPGERAGVPPRE
jgi:peptidoglycan/xylan/chitin deacetylase (PgdA/CDA1 family)